MLSLSVLFLNGCLVLRYYVDHRKQAVISVARMSYGCDRAVVSGLSLAHHTKLHLITVSVIIRP